MSIYIYILLLVVTIYILKFGMFQYNNTILIGTVNYLCEYNIFYLTNILPNVYDKFRKLHILSYNSFYSPIKKFIDIILTCMHSFLIPSYER